MCKFVPSCMDKYKTVHPLTIAEPLCCDCRSQCLDSILSQVELETEVEVDRSWGDGFEFKITGNSK